MLVVFKKGNNSISIIRPVKKYVEEYTLDVLAKKDTPPGLPYWIITEDEIPDDRIFRSAWEIPDEWSEPDGYGSEFHTFEEIINAENQSE